MLCAIDLMPCQEFIVPALLSKKQYDAIVQISKVCYNEYSISQKKGLLIKQSMELVSEALRLVC